MNHRPMLGLIALVVAITSAIAVVLFLTMPTEVFAATGVVSTPRGNAEPQPLTLWLSGAGVVVWLALRRS